VRTERHPVPRRSVRIPLLGGRERRVERRPSGAPAGDEERRERAERDCRGAEDQCRVKPSTKLVGVV